MNKLKDNELAALEAWMSDKRLSGRKAAVLLGVSNNRVTQWQRGEGPSDSQYELLMQHITPYHASPSLVPLCSFYVMQNVMRELKSSMHSA